LARKARATRIKSNTTQLGEGGSSWTALEQKLGRESLPQSDHVAAYHLPAVAHDLTPV
jgi:hypothetical protein